MSTGLVHQISGGDENAAVSHAKNGKPRPLHASTNVIHAKTPRRIDNLIYDKSLQLPGKQLNDPLKKKRALSSKKQSDLRSSQISKSKDSGDHTHNSCLKKTSSTPVEKVDENDVMSMVKNAYDPLEDFYSFDEDLFKKVMKLECADDGIPAFDYSEPFDF